MELVVRSMVPGDRVWIVGTVDEWWGRPVASGLQRLFFDHFSTTSFVADSAGDHVGFLLGFMSPSQPDVAYVHFAGVSPAHRTLSIGRSMYQAFFDLAALNGRHRVCAVTNAVNSGSISFHRRLGFVTSDPIEGYDRPDVAHVTFSRQLR